MRQLIALTLISTIIFSCSNTTSENTTEATEEGEFVEYNNPPAEGFNIEGSDMIAMLLADKCMQAMGGREAWDNTRYLSWNFFGRRNHLWDKWTGDVRIEVPDTELTILMNINSQEGRAMRGGVEITDSLDYFLKRGYGWWINDSYWLVMPYKLKDSGVTLRYLREDTTEMGAPADVLSMSFENVGVTPQNVYNVWVDVESKLITQWSYYPDSSALEPRFVTPWSDYSQYGEILLSGNRGDYQLSSISVPTEVQAEVFTDFNSEVAFWQ